MQYPCLEFVPLLEQTNSSILKLTQAYSSLLKLTPTFRTMSTSGHFFLNIKSVYNIITLQGLQ
jgi:hypothetical protein